MVYVIQVCWQLVSRIRTELVKPAPSWSCTQAVWHIPLLCVQWKTRDDGQRNCPKHVDFYSKNKFGKLVHLVGFIIRIYHDARSPERQTESIVVQSNILACSREYRCRGNATLPSVCTAQPLVTANNIKNIVRCTTMHLWRIYVIDHTKAYFGPYVGCPIFPPPPFWFQPNLEILKRFHPSLQHQVSPKCVQC